MVYNGVGLHILICYQQYLAAVHRHYKYTDSYQVLKMSYL